MHNKIYTRKTEKIYGPIYHRRNTTRSSATV